MKKLISLTLSIMMIMSLVAVPVSADEAAAPVIVTPATEDVTPAFHISADSMRTSTNYTNRNETAITVSYNNPGSFKWKTEAGTEIGGRATATYIYDAATAPETLTAWEGFKVVADGVTASASGAKYTMGNMRPSMGLPGHTVPGISVGTIDAFNGKDMRADSIRFMLPDAQPAAEGVPAGVLLFGAHITKSWYETSGADSPTALRVVNGGAYSIDMSDPANGTNWTAFIPEGTIQPGKWYRAERILDMRIDDGVGSKDLNRLAASGGTGDSAWSTTTENWQRFIVYEEHADGESIVGDSGWVLTSRYTKADTHHPTQPSDATVFATVGYPAGSCVYFDDVKAWAVAAPLGDVTIGSETDVRNKWLTFPAQENSVYKDNKAVGIGIYAKSGQYGQEQGDSETVYTSAKGTSSKYIYLQESFMIPEVSTTEIGLLDLGMGGTQSYNTCNTDWGAGYTKGYTRVNGLLRIKKDASTGNAVLTVKEWDVTTDFDTSEEGVQKGFYNDAINVPLKNGDAFELTLKPGEWYKATVKIDQSMHLVNGSLSLTKAPQIKQADGTWVEAAITDTTKATVIIEDSQGNVYETEEFTWRSPRNYLYYGYYGAVVFADGRRPGSSTDSFGFKISLDNIKCVLSNGAIDDETAYQFYEESFDDDITGAAFSDITTYNTNFQNANSAIEASETIEGVPTGFSVALNNEINGTNIADAVKLYKGDIDVTGDHVTSVTYNADTQTIALGLSALFPFTEYKVVISRNDLADVEANIFAAIPGNAKEAVYTFKTGASDESTLVFTPNFVIEDDVLENYLPFSDNEGYRIYAPYEDLGVPMATIQSYNEYDTSYVAIAAIYDADGKMEDMISETGVVPARKTINVTFGFDPAEQTSGFLTITNKTATLKSFVWNTWTLMDPFGEAYIYPPVQ